MLTVPIDTLPPGLRREIERNPELFTTDFDVMNALQFSESRDLQREFCGSLSDYLGFCHAHAGGTCVSGWKSPGQFAPPPPPSVSASLAANRATPSESEVGHATCAIDLFAAMQQGVVVK